MTDSQLLPLFLPWHHVQLTAQVPAATTQKALTFILTQKLYCLWVPPGLIPQLNSFLSAVEYFIFPISESTYVKKKRERNPISPARVCETNNAASTEP